MRFVLLVPLLCLAASAGAQQPDPQTLDDALRSATANAPREQGLERGPRPATNPATWVTTEDYPAWATRLDVTGRVRLKVAVDRRGQITGCEVLQGSGVTDLDTIACQKVTERASFMPARDRRGRAVDGTWTTTVVWAIDSQQAAPEPGNLAMAMVVERDGTVSSCVIEEATGAATAVFRSANSCPTARRFKPILDENGQAQRTRIRVTTGITRESVDH
jgi:protein TonB